MGMARSTNCTAACEQLTAARSLLVCRLGSQAARLHASGPVDVQHMAGGAHGTAVVPGADATVCRYLITPPWTGAQDGSVV
jgi:hypothetical protein